VEEDFGLGIGIRWEAQVGERWIFRFAANTAGAGRAAVGRPDLPFIGGRRRSGCVPAEPYPPRPHRGDYQAGPDSKGVGA